MLLAARAITHLADVMPAACSSIVRHGAVNVLCSRLLSIEYIDLAEQSLQALQKLSQEHPQSVLRQGGLLAVLSFLDFFQTSVQRIAVATAANMCRGLTSESLEAVTAAVPILTNLLQYEVCHSPLAISTPEASIQSGRGRGVGGGRILHPLEIIPPVSIVTLYWKP